MSGPPYPHPNPAPGSNAIGSFTIGVSPIGTITAFDYWRTVLSQYANSERLTAMIGSFASAIDQTANLDAFFDDIWNIDTAQGYGLDVWGQILNVGRVLQVAGGNYLGFEEATTGETFNNSTFFVGVGLTSNYSLSDDAYRTLLFAKALANVSDGSMKSINQLLLTLFPNRGNCYVKEGGVFDGGFFGFTESVTDGQPFGIAPFYSNLQLPFMVITYVFEFALTALELAIVQQSGVLPTPTGVEAEIVQL